MELEKSESYGDQDRLSQPLDAQPQTFEDKKYSAVAISRGLLDPKQLKKLPEIRIFFDENRFRKSWLFVPMSAEKTLAKFLQIDCEKLTKLDRKGGRSVFHAIALNEQGFCGGGDMMKRVGEHLLHHGATFDVNKKDAFGATPLHYALVKGQSGSLELLELGADVNISLELRRHTRTSIVTPLQIAVANDSTNYMEGHLMLQSLLERGANINDTLSPFGWTVLHLVARSIMNPMANCNTKINAYYGYKSVMTLLNWHTLDRTSGKDIVDAVDQAGWTALHHLLYLDPFHKYATDLAWKEQHLMVVQVLLDRCDPKKLNKELFYGCYPVSHILWEICNPLDGKKEEGDNAIYYHGIRILELLLGHKGRKEIDFRTDDLTASGVPRLHEMIREDYPEYSESPEYEGHITRTILFFGGGASLPGLKLNQIDKTSGQTILHVIAQATQLQRQNPSMQNRKVGSRHIYENVVRIAMDGDHAIDFNHVDHKGFTALYYAIINGNFQLSYILARSGEVALDSLLAAFGRPINDKALATDPTVRERILGLLKGKESIESGSIEAFNNALGLLLELLSKSDGPSYYIGTKSDDGEEIQRCIFQAIRHNDISRACNLIRSCRDTASAIVDFSNQVYRAFDCTSILHVLAEARKASNESHYQVVQRYYLYKDCIDYLKEDCRREVTTCVDHFAITDKVRGYTAFHQAMISENWEFATLLERSGKLDPTQMALIDKTTNRTILHVIADTKRNDLLESDPESLLIDVPARPTYTQVIEIFKFTINAIMQNLAEANDLINQVDYRGYTAFHYAVINRNFRFADLLLFTGMVNTSVYPRHLLCQIEEDYDSNVLRLADGMRFTRALISKYQPYRYAETLELDRFQPTADQVVQLINLKTVLCVESSFKQAEDNFTYFIDRHNYRPTKSYTQYATQLTTLHYAIFTEDTDLITAVLEAAGNERRREKNDGEVVVNVNARFGPFQETPLHFSVARFRSTDGRVLEHFLEMAKLYDSGLHLCPRRSTGSLLDGNHRPDHESYDKGTALTLAEPGSVELRYLQNFDLEDAVTVSRYSEGGHELKCAHHNTFCNPTGIPAKELAYDTRNECFALRYPDPCQRPHQLLQQLCDSRIKSKEEEEEEEDDWLLQKIKVGEDLRWVF